MGETEDVGRDPAGLPGAKAPCDRCSATVGVQFVETLDGPVPLCPRCRKAARSE